MQGQEIHAAIRTIKREIARWPDPVVGVVARQSGRDPFLVLMSCLLSLRTKDKTTAEASQRLFALASTPDRMRQLTRSVLEQALYPVGFYRTKAKQIQQICAQLLERYQGRVPDRIDELLTLPGVGRKTANLVVTVGYEKPGICVDIHVHRISNRWGYVKTRTPDETEQALRDKLPRKYWITFNDLLVPYGQNLCQPLSPFCSRCKIAEYCDRVGVIENISGGKERLTTIQAVSLRATFVGDVEPLALSPSCGHSAFRSTGGASIRGTNLRPPISSWRPSGLFRRCY